MRCTISIWEAYEAMFPKSELYVLNQVLIRYYFNFHLIIDQAISLLRKGWTVKVNPLFQKEICFHTLFVL